MYVFDDRRDMEVFKRVVRCTSCKGDNIVRIYHPDTTNVTFVCNKCGTEFVFGDGKVGIDYGIE